jgi:hypothetical protein
MFFCVASSAVFGAPLVGVANVNVTSDTAVTAKNMAFDEARRQIIIDTLSPYSDASVLRSAVANEKSSVLANLIASSGISKEKLSDTAYSASITMTVDRMAAKKWMGDKDIQNWLSLTEDSGNQFMVVANLENKLADWSRIRRIASNAGIDLDTRSINGTQVVFGVQSGRRGALTIALRDAGWKYQDRDGVLYIFR